MEKYVLSVPQMIELINLGLDTSGAEFYWFQDVSWEEPRVIEKDILGEELKTRPKKCTPTFILQNILEMLPNIKGYYYPDLRQVTKLEWQVIYKPQLGELPWLYKYGTTSIEAAGNMLQWCLENKYL